MDTPNLNRRWYDRRTEHSSCVRLIEAFPDDIQVVIAEAIIYLSEEEFRIQELMTSLKSLGPEKIMGIHKSKGKKRHADRLPEVHKALNYFYILSDPQRDILVRYVGDMVKVFYAYIDHCRKSGYPLQMEEIRALASTYQRQGLQASQVLLAGLNSRRLVKKPVTVLNIKEHSEGMKIRKTD